MIRHGDAGLTVVHGLVHEPLDAGLSVENRILGMYVKMYELRHSCVAVNIDSISLSRQEVYPFAKVAFFPVISMAGLLHFITEAEITKSMLDSAGIWSMIRNEYMSAIYPIGTMPAQVVVREEDFEKARTMLRHR